MTRIRPALVIFQGGAAVSPSPLERMVGDAQAAATLDLLSDISQNDTFSQAILITEHQPLADAAEADAQGRQAGPRLIIERKVESDQPFQFGESLRHVCAKHGLERVVYVGGGSIPLHAIQELEDLALAVSGDGACVAANNLYSADVVAFQPASALERIPLPATDNNLAWLLHFEGGLPFSAMQRTLATQFDLDTPTDLTTLWWSSLVPPLDKAVGLHLAEMLKRVPEELPTLASKVEQAYKIMSTRRAEVLVAGRVNSFVWRRLETNLPCQTRIISEERGLRASGRDVRGEARSILGMYADIAGISGLIKAIEQVCQAAFLDTRVLHAHRGLNVTPQDRFASDAFMLDLISDLWVREFTEAVISSNIPIVMGGHSLVAGGVWALSERVRAASSATDS